ncbi:terpenoid synthase [Obba rivulosa]|uniref:Terpene synthase n=1 Tax=Obba rivulosa TaxID=1052685 RepID=A0A8E2AKH0_9APHY|nr:terpenoid synthase [Obba rivulosa]
MSPPPVPAWIILPDLIALCPFEGSINTHYPEAAHESSAWIDSFKMFKDRKREFFLQGGSELLCAHVFPYADYDKFRTCCDFINVLFTMDEISDDQDEKDAHKTGLVLLNALREPEWDDGTKLAKMCRELRNRLARDSGPICYRRLVQLCSDYINAVAVEAGLRARGVVLEVDAYVRLRRDNSAVRFSFGLFGSILGVDLPDEVYENPVFSRMNDAAIDMVCWANDLYSYNMEQAMGHTTNNIITVLMEHGHVDLQNAVDLVGGHWDELMNNFLANKKSLPSWGPELDLKVAAYIKGMEYWVVGNLHWSFRTVRYFGRAREEVQRTRIVHLAKRRFDLEGSEDKGLY